MAAVHAAEGVPFDRGAGFSVARAIDEAPDWAWRVGLIPDDFEAVAQAARNERGFGPARDRLAELYATLGAYERALEMDRPNARSSGPIDRRAAHRTLWCLLQLGDLRAAGIAARRLDRALGVPKGAPGSWASRVAAWADLPGEERNAELGQLPLYDLERALDVQIGLRGAEDWADETPPAMSR